MYPNNILFNKNNIFSKIPIKHNSSQHNHFLKKKKKKVKKLIQKE